MIVVDASVLVSALLDDGPDAAWSVEQVRGGGPLTAPAHAPFEAANVIRRLEAAGLVDRTSAALAHRDLGDLALVLHPYESVATRAWELRHNATIYDAAYLALAEALDAPLATLDARLARAPGSTATVRTPGDG